MAALARVIRSFTDITLTRYSDLASSTIILYDHLITLDDEIELIWKAPLSSGKILFFLNRYYTLASAIVMKYGLFSNDLTDETEFTLNPSSSCLSFFRWQGFTGLLAPMIAEIILQMRVYALYLMNKRLLVFMVVCFIISTTTSAAIILIVINGIEVSSKIPFSDIKFCILTEVSSQFFAFWIPSMVFESLLFGLVVWRAWRTSVFPVATPTEVRSAILGLFIPSRGYPEAPRERMNRSRFGSEGRGLDLAKMIVSDSVLYYGVVFATYLTNFLVFLLGRESLHEVSIGFTIAMSCVLSNRLLFNIRRASHPGHHKGPSGSDLSSSWVVGGESAMKRDVEFGSVSVLSETEMNTLRSLKSNR